MLRSRSGPLLYRRGGVTGGWGAQPIGQCGNPERCGEKVIGLDDQDLALVDMHVAGAT
jgi:hypothetical protein